MASKSYNNTTVAEVIALSEDGYPTWRIANTLRMSQRDVEHILKDRKDVHKNYLLEDDFDE